MKSTVIPWICGLTLTAMAGAGASHWFSVRQLVATMESGTLPRPQAPQPAPIPAPPSPSPVAATAEALVQVSAAPKQAASPVASDSPDQREFYRQLLEEMKRLKDENRDLHDQVAETNRDVTGLQFRIDQFSDHYRKMPVADNAEPVRLDAPEPLRFVTPASDAPAADNDVAQPGVLPPKALPIPRSVIPR